MNGVKIYDKVDGLWIPHINLQLFAGNTYYVDYATGADSNNGTSTSTPLKHCPGDPNYNPSGSAPTALLAGDTVIFKGGVRYYSYITCNWAGSSEDRIIYDGNSAGTWGTGQPVIDSQNTRTTFFNINQKSYITIKNFECTNGASLYAYRAGIWSDGVSSNVTIQNCFVHDNLHKGMYLTYIDDLLVKDNEISGHLDEANQFCYWAVNVAFCSDAIVEGNYIHDNGIGTAFAQVTGLKIRYNYYRDHWRPITEDHHEDHFLIADSSGVEVYCNKFEGDPYNDQGLFFTYGALATGTIAEIWSNIIIGTGANIACRNGGNAPDTALKVYNNSFYTWPAQATVKMIEGSDITDFKNNIIHNISTWTMVAIHSPGSFAGDKNCYWHDVTNGRWAWQWNSPGQILCLTLAEWQSASGQDANAIFADPKYTDPDNEDLTLQNDSPCIGSGIDLSGLDAKYAEALKPGCTFPNPETTIRTGSWDMGAYKNENEKLVLVLKS